eukprot:m.436386 g.436386  ORF g.436386 m.436386 type:complete len:457 (+) comp20269_c1_seq3:142-1512(+)
MGWLGSREYSCCAEEGAGATASSSSEGMSPPPRLRPPAPTSTPRPRFWFALKRSAPLSRPRLRVHPPRTSTSWYSDGGAHALSRSPTPAPAPAPLPYSYAHAAATPAQNRKHVATGHTPIASTANAAHTHSTLLLSGFVPDPDMPDQTGRRLAKSLYTALLHLWEVEESGVGARGRFWLLWLGANTPSRWAEQTHAGGWDAHVIAALDRSKDLTRLTEAEAADVIADCTEPVGKDEVMFWPTNSRQGFVVVHDRAERLEQAVGMLKAMLQRFPHSVVEPTWPTLREHVKVIEEDWEGRAVSYRELRREGQASKALFLQATSANLKHAVGDDGDADPELFLEYRHFGSVQVMQLDYGVVTEQFVNWLLRNNNILLVDLSGTEVISASGKGNFEMGDFFASLPSEKQRAMANKVCWVHFVDLGAFSRKHQLDADIAEALVATHRRWQGYYGQVIMLDA